MKLVWTVVDTKIGTGYVCSRHKTREAAELSLARIQDQAKRAGLDVALEVRGPA